MKTQATFHDAEDDDDDDDESVSLNPQATSS